MATSSNDHAISTSELPPFPSPTTFSILPDIYALLSRLDVLSPSDAPNGLGHAQATQHPNGLAAPDPGVDVPMTSDDADTTQAPRVAAQSDGPAGSASTSGTAGTDRFPLKELTYNLHPIRRKIEAAREVVRGLPDVGRGVEEQEREIRELEGRCRGLRARVRGLRALAREETGVRKEDGKGDGQAGERRDVVMLGVEGG